MKIIVVPLSAKTFSPYQVVLSVETLEDQQDLLTIAARDLVIPDAIVKAGCMSQFGSSHERVHRFLNRLWNSLSEKRLA